MYLKVLSTLRTYFTSDFYVYQTKIVMRFFGNDSTLPRPKLVITAQDEQFDPVTLQNWRAEGFEVFYLPFVGSREAYVHYLQHLADPLELGQDFAIIGRLSLLRTKSSTSH